jgi:hypothetical protein
MVTRLPLPLGDRIVGFGDARRNLELGFCKHRLDQVRGAGIALAEMTMADSDPHRVRTDREPDLAAQASTFMTCPFMPCHRIPPGFVPRAVN